MLPSQLLELRVVPGKPRGFRVFQTERVIMASYADILFGKIVIKNGLAPLATVQECLQIQETSKARGLSMTLPEVMVARAAITDEQARLASRAQALTQLQRAESIYAKIVHERGLVPFQVLQESFAQQKQRRFAVRISQILLERGLLTSDQNEEIVEEQLVRLGEETRLQEEVGLAGSTPLMEDSRVQRLTAEQQRLQDLAASTFRNAAPRTPGGHSFTGSTPDARPRSNEVARSHEVARPGEPPRSGELARPPAMPASPLPAMPPAGSFRTGSGRVHAAGSPPPAVAAAGARSERTMELDAPSAFVPSGIPTVSTDDLDSWGADSKNARQAAAAVAGIKKGAPPPPADPNSLSGKTISSRYRILEKLGEGGMGTVYKAEHCLMEKIVAFKVLHPHLITNKQSLERFRREVRAASKFQHKNVIQIYDAGEGEGGIFYMAMEFIEGVSLESMLQNGPLPIDRTILILRQTLKALGEAHKKGIVHRDMKSDNIMITKGKHGEDLVKVMDFGIAKILDQESTDSENEKGERIYKTMEGVITGTPQYMSPEQAEGKKVDHRADLYSLGCIVFEMLTGKLPFESETAMGFLGKHIVEEPPLASSVHKGVPPALDRIVKKLLEKEPDARYQTAGEIFKDLEEQVTGDFLEVKPAAGTLSGEEVTPKQVAEKKGPPPLVLALVALAVAIFLGGGVLVVYMVLHGRAAGPAKAIEQAEVLRAEGKLDEALARVRRELSTSPGDKSLVAEQEALAGQLGARLSEDAEVDAGSPDVHVAMGALARLARAKDLVPASASTAAALAKLTERLKAEAERTGDPELVKALEGVGVKVAPPPSPAPTGAPTSAPRPSLPPIDEPSPTPSPPDKKPEDKKPDDKKPDDKKPDDKGASADPAEKARAFAAALKASLDAIANGPDLAAASAKLDEAAKLAPGLGDDAKARLDARSEALGTLRASVPRFDEAHGILEQLASQPDGAADKIERAGKALDDWSTALASLRDQDVAAALADRTGAERARLVSAREKLPGEDPLRPWRDSVTRFRDQQLPALLASRKGEAITSALYDLKSAPAFAKATPAEQKWIADSLTRFTHRTKAWAKVPARYVTLPGGPYTLARSPLPGGKPETVTLGDYSIDSTETTQADWDAYLDAVPGAPRPQGFEGSVDLPVENVSADEAARYAEWLTKKTDGLVVFRLPTEAEWERAARGTSGNDYPWGTELRADRDAGRAAVGGSLRKVKAFDANDLGLYDTCGNVAELTSTERGGKRVVKGGSVHSGAEKARASSRELVPPGEKTPFLGFRLVAVETGP